MCDCRSHSVKSSFSRVFRGFRPKSENFVTAERPNRNDIRRARFPYARRPAARWAVVFGERGLRAPLKVCQKRPKPYGDLWTFREESYEIRSCSNEAATAYRSTRNRRLHVVRTNVTNTTNTTPRLPLQYDLNVLIRKVFARRCGAREEYRTPETVLLLFFSSLLLFSSPPRCRRCRSFVRSFDRPFFRGATLIPANKN